MGQDRYKCSVSLPTELGTSLETNICPGLPKEFLMPPFSLVPVLFRQLALACWVSISYLDKRNWSTAKLSQLRRSFLSMHKRFPSTQTCPKVTSTHMHTITTLVLWSTEVRALQGKATHLLRQHINWNKNLYGNRKKITLNPDSPRFKIRIEWTQPICMI